MKCSKDFHWYDDNDTNAQARLNKIKLTNLTLFENICLCRVVSIRSYAHNFKELTNKSFKNLLPKQHTTAYLRSKRAPSSEQFVVTKSDLAKYIGLGFRFHNTKGGVWWSHSDLCAALNSPSQKYKQDINLQFLRRCGGQFCFGCPHHNQIIIVL